MEDELWTLEEMKIPHGNDTVRFIQRSGILVVRGYTELRVLKQ